METSLGGELTVKMLAPRNPKKDRATFWVVDVFRRDG